MDFLIPQLKLPFERPLNELEKQLLDQQDKIESWFKTQWPSDPILFTSVDLRNAGFKIAAVDTNLFPAGFNNLHPSLYPYAIQAIQHTLQQCYPHIKCILIIPESHTRNPHYYQSVATLAHLLEKSEYQVKIGSLLAQEEAISVEIDHHQELILHPLQKRNQKVSCQGAEPCLVLLNHDLSDGIPAPLLEIKQPIEPPLGLGWFARSKSTHFTYYHKICQQFAQFLAMDVWQISPLFLDCEGVDFLQREGLECLVPKVESLLQQIQKKYDEYQIKDKPFVAIKADAGTYGMAVMMVHDPSELDQLNRKQRTRMSTSKGGRSVNRVILQEGIKTIESVPHHHELAVAEPVIYLAGYHPIGGFFRVNKKRGQEENLNATGMHFEKLAHVNNHLIAHPRNDLFYVYSIIARLAFLAACQEKNHLT